MLTPSSHTSNINVSLYCGRFNECSELIAKLVVDIVILIASAKRECEDRLHIGNLVRVSIAVKIEVTSVDARVDAQHVAVKTDTPKVSLMVPNRTPFMVNGPRLFFSDLVGIKRTKQIMKLMPPVKLKGYSHANAEIIGPAYSVTMGWGLRTAVSAPCPLSLPVAPRLAGSAAPNSKRHRVATKQSIAK